MADTIPVATASIVVYGDADALGVPGWLLTNAYTRASDGYRVETYVGPKTSLEAFVAAVKTVYPNNYTDISENVSAAVAEVTVTVGEEKTGEGGQGEATTDVKDPDYQISPSIEEIPLECKEDYDGLTAEEIARIKDAVEKADTDYIDTLAGAAAQLAYWLQMGVTTYKQPCFVVSVTRYLKLRTLIPGDVYDGCGGVTASVPGVPSAALPAGGWEYLKLCPVVQPEAKWLRCSYQYLGAKRWPSFYPGGSWTPPGQGGGGGNG